MVMVLPGVSYNDALLTPVHNDNPVTIPLFIGHTSAEAVRPLTAMQLVSVGSLTQSDTYLGQNGTLAYSLRHFFENGGRQCCVLSLGPGKEEPADRLKDLIAALQTTQMLETVLDDDQTGLILVPEMSELNDVGVAGSNATEFNVASLWYEGWKALLTLCFQDQPRFALLELPEDPAQAEVLSQQMFSTDCCQRGAAWWPRLETSYKSGTSGYITLSPLPAVAAVIQRSANEKGIWKAPANIPLAKTLRPTRSPQTAQRLLGNTGVSCNLIRSFIGKGIRLWGCRTLLNQQDSPWRYIQTRLLVNSVQQHLRTMTRAYVFEPNNAQTWMKVKGQVWTWLRQQWLTGAFFGTVEEDAFSLSIGLNETMSEEDIRNGRMVLKISLALLAPAEFIDISLTLNMRDAIARQGGTP